MNLSEYLKNYIKGSWVLYSFFAFFLHPILEWKRWKSFFGFRKKMKCFRASPCNPSKGKLLVVSLQGDFIAALLEESFLAKSAQLAGFDPVILTNKGTWGPRYYRSLGIEHFVFFEEFLLKKKHRLNLASEVVALAERITSFKDLMKLTYEGVQIGKYICSSLLRRSHRGRIDVQNAEVRSLIRDFLFRSIVNVKVAREVLDSVKPHSILFLERGYTPYGEFFDLAIQRGLNTVQWCGCHKDAAFMLKRFHAGNIDQHPASLSPKTWERMKSLPWGPERGNAVRQELFQNYQAGSWFSEVGTQFKSRIMEKEKVLDVLGVDRTKKTAVIFPHLFWDATFFWGEDIFENYEEWFTETVKAASMNSNMNWIIKVHPANLVKLRRDGYKGELAELAALKSVTKTLPAHIKILYPDTSISTFSLYQCIDYAVTVRGTIGIEASLFGVPVVTAGTGRYDRHGFTIDSTSREGYRDTIQRLHEFPRLNAGQIELAEKFAYATFLLRPFELSSLEISYERNAKATPKVQYRVTSLEKFMNAKDVREFGRWFKGTEEDYMDLSRLI